MQGAVGEKSRYKSVGCFVWRIPVIYAGYFPLGVMPNGFFDAMDENVNAKKNNNPNMICTRMRRIL